MGMLRTDVVKSIPDYLETMTSTFNMYTSNMGEDSLDFNLIDLYIDELFNDCIRVSFDSMEKAMYNKNPKKLSHALWNTTDLFFIIQAMNDFVDFEDMDLSTRKYIYIPNETSLRFIIELTRKKINGNIASFIPD